MSSLEMLKSFVAVVEKSDAPAAKEMVKLDLKKITSGICDSVKAATNEQSGEDADVRLAKLEKRIEDIDGMLTGAAMEGEEAVCAKSETSVFFAKGEAPPLVSPEKPPADLAAKPPVAKVEKEDADESLKDLAPPNYLSHGDDMAPKAKTKMTKADLETRGSVFVPAQVGSANREKQKLAKRRVSGVNVSGGLRGR